ncbi:complement C1q subcomponent subunit B-like [Scleropages formosus]|uniref:Complement C1q B chain n=1 Tax=Scleropages formosus TaxID=113540 RepID=A0A0N8JYM6_SCLFO|nr:complement C1q subcomponent subunit B-like [Scleropages formosus]XP_018591750.1 complement C1q subcomponent subunit B-like [Scleropages formosus]KPP66961.1 complement C1q subcomponent subunit B-like [Scleropages formosus]
MAGTGVVLLGVLISFVASSAADTCSAFRGYPGVPGIPGAHGPNGKDGQKGERGEKGDSGLMLKGQKGEPGLLGPPGRVGLPGDPGVPGFSGPVGPKGEKGMSVNAMPFQRSTFSYKYALSRMPRKDQPIRFERAIESTISLQNGVFQCKVRGYYYLTYHVTGRSKVCINIMKGEEIVVGFCDSTQRGFLVTSASVIQELMVGDEVSIQTTDDNAVMGTDGADSIFTGFLLFPTS